MMYFKSNIKIVVLSLFLLGALAKGQAQCYLDEIVTASFATNGLSPYKDDVLWLTWGSINQEIEPHGAHNRRLRVQSKSYASIALGDNQWLCIEAEITAISGGPIYSYAPGNFEGDFLDDLYNIGGTDKSNKLVSGILNGSNGMTNVITIICKATIDGVPVRLAGLVVADAESLAEQEYIHATADGNWTLVEVKKNIGRAAYNVRKEIVNENGVATTKRTLKFLRGNDQETMAVSFLKFNESAYNNPDLSVTIVAEIKGNGRTAIALGLLPPDVDGGDAPKTYGYPMHLLQRLNFSLDNIVVVDPGSTSITNINTTEYMPGGLIPNSELSRLGSTAPDTERVSLYSSNAMGDNNHGLAGALEEDAWPAEYQSLSHKVYLPNTEIKATIPYRSSTEVYITGWIDFDLNGTFDPSEKSEVLAPATSATGGSVVLKWTVPPTRIAYGTFVRLRLSETPNISPTETVNNGEVEDHRMRVLVPIVTNPMIHSRGKEKP